MVAVGAVSAKKYGRPEAEAHMEIEAEMPKL